VIPYGKQDINQADIDAVVNVLKSDFLTQGAQTPLFEKIVSNYCGSKYGVAVNSATSALHVACLSLNLGKGDWLWTSPNSFVASANCGLYCGAKIDFVDVDTQTYNMSVVELEKKLIHAKQEKKLPKIVIPVHFAG
jgi:dTDP-4-amino-4,6-dideoxygalactose transaminase